jgi:hypothetical protein
LYAARPQAWHLHSQLHVWTAKTWGKHALVPKFHFLWVFINVLIDK